MSRFNSPSTPGTAIIQNPTGRGSPNQITHSRKKDCPSIKIITFIGLLRTHLFLGYPIFPNFLAAPLKSYTTCLIPESRQVHHSSTREARSLRKGDIREKRTAESKFFDESPKVESKMENFPPTPAMRPHQMPVRYAREDEIEVELEWFDV
jgi:hypothetical protein